MKNRFALLFILTTTLCACNGGNNHEIDIINISANLENGEEVILANDDVYQFASNYTYGCSRDYLGKGDIYMPKPVRLSWDKVKKAESYKIRISLDDKFNTFDSYIVNDNQIDIEDLYVDSTYYWDIEAINKNNGVIGITESKVFKTAKTPRTIYIDGVSNTRDIGGYITEDGKKIKQGMIYRAAKLDYITDEGLAKAHDVYKIKTDLDLRRNEEVHTFFSPLGDDVNFIHVPSPWWIGENGIDQSMWWSSICRDFEVFADEENYPIIFHCSIGQDRTGTLAFLLGALLGMNPTDLSLDYELSSFSSIVWDINSPIYVDDKLRYQYGPLYDYINNPRWGETLSERTEFFLKMIGMEEDELETIKNIMLINI